MRALFRLALAVAVTAVLLPSTSNGQGAPSEALVRRVDSLQSRVNELESRVAELENLLNATPTGTPASPAAADSRDIANWRRLRENMSMDDVRSLLGEPERIEGGSVAFWYYPRNGEVAFVSGRLTRWSEPAR